MGIHVFYFVKPFKLPSLFLEMHRSSQFAFQTYTLAQERKTLVLDFRPRSKIERNGRDKGLAKVFALFKFYAVQKLRDPSASVRIR